MRRFLIIFILLGLIGGGIWLFFFRKNPSEAPVSSGSFFQTFFSRNNTAPEQQDDPLGQADVVIPDIAPSSPFSVVTRFPIAGYIPIKKTKTVTVPASDPRQKPTTQTTTESSLRVVSRVNGYVYEIKDGASPLQISNIYIPNVYEAIFSPEGTFAFVRFLKDDQRTIGSYSIPVPEQNPDGTRTQKEGFYFPDNATAATLSPDGKTVATVIPQNEGVSITTATITNTNRKELLRTPFKEWLVLWGGGTVYLQTKAAAVAEGFLYKVDSAGKRLLRVVGGVPGLTTSMSPSGTYLLYSQSGNETLQTFLLNTKTGVTRSVGALILPEKCTWLKNEDLICAGNDFLVPASYPDAWYQGIVSFSDKLYRIGVSGNYIEELDGGTFPYDAISLFADEAERSLYFIEKTTGVLWRFNY